MLSTSQGSVLCKNMVIQTWTVLYHKCVVLFEKVCTYHTFSSLCKDQFGLHVYIVSYCEVFSFSKERQSYFYICWNINNPILVWEQKALDFRVFCWDFISAQHHGKFMWCWKCYISRWPVNFSIWFGSITCLFNIFSFFPSLTSWQTQVLGSKTWNLVAINTYFFWGGTTVAWSIVVTQPEGSKNKTNPKTTTASGEISEICLFEIAVKRLHSKYSAVINL